MIYIKRYYKLTIICLTFLLSPLTAFALPNQVYLGGESIGIEVDLEGVLISGLYKVNENNPGSNAGLRPGDIIVEVDQQKVSKISDLIALTKDKEKVELKFKRNKQIKTTTLFLEKGNDNTFKTGLLVKDKISGIGTLTFIDPNSNIFAALGHEIVDSSSREIIESSHGMIYSSVVTDIKRSEMGNPGGKNAKVNKDDLIGHIDKVNKFGIFGRYHIPITKKLVFYKPYNQISIGKAQIVTVLEGKQEMVFDINIMKLYDISKRDSKQIVFEITDSELLQKANGVVQGMSGSPIIQDGKIIGCVTHVMVNDVTKGYGIYIETLAKQIY